MYKDEKIEFEDSVSMTKEDAIEAIKKFFKGNKKFIDLASSIILSTHHFNKLNSMDFQTENWNWEKFMKISIDTEIGFKHFCYRKGNKKYAPGNVRADLEGNNTHEIDEFNLVIYYRENQKLEEYTL
ncbi:hypothetical protein LS684_04245 [Cytobacillus spongiae]|uniref:hypothetical protein n=1 Tax=Cytobacillus spongiae TaxID=2901381 RepID=UPI001F37A441|nr:hypothetical protein [Cytobacillus spongiae]UII56682.1 hypothetical protein LS684_04245 [Cytobacillus spongiae]